MDFNPFKKKKPLKPAETPTVHQPFPPIKLPKPGIPYPKGGLGTSTTNRISALTKGIF